MAQTPLFNLIFLGVLGWPWVGRVHLVDDLRVFRATEGSTESVPLVFNVETVRWPTVAKKGGKWYRGVLEAAE